MSQTVTIYGPNLPNSLSKHGTFVVHAAGCKDLQRAAYKRLGADTNCDTREFNSIQDVIVDIYEPDNFEYDENDPEQFAPYRNDVHFFPCVDLPETVEVADSPKFRYEAVLTSGIVITVESNLGLSESQVKKAVISQFPGSKVNEVKNVVS